MKILQINVWTGRIKGALPDFLAKNKFDVICMQEAVWTEERSEVLEDFFVSVDQIKEITGMKYDFRSVNWTVEAFMGMKMYQGNVILSREKIVDAREEIVYGGALDATAALDLTCHQYTAQRVLLENEFNIVNYHGYWLTDPMGNGETVKAMRNAARLASEAEGPVVMCGDLNVVHASPAMRELDFLRDLTDEYGISSTLSRLKFVGDVACDHILVSEDVNVKDFRVLDAPIISDHKALVAEVES